MTQLWPRVQASVVQALISSRGIDASSRDEHIDQVYAATGGTRVSTAQIRELRGRLEQIAYEQGYPNPSTASQRIAFDRASAAVIRNLMQITCFEASQPGVWNFLAGVAMPGLTIWRFGFDNVERWVATDLTRHMFARLWWQGYVFGIRGEDGVIDYAILNALTESDLNALTERRSLAGIPRLARVVATQIIGSPVDERRQLIRATTRSVNRSLPYIDFASLSDEQIDDFVRIAIRRSGPQSV